MQLGRVRSLLRPAGFPLLGAGSGSGEHIRMGSSFCCISYLHTILKRRIAAKIYQFFANLVFNGTEMLIFFVFEIS